MIKGGGRKRKAASAPKKKAAHGRLMTAHFVFLVRKPYTSRRNVLVNLMNCHDVVKHRIPGCDTHLATSLACLRLILAASHSRLNTVTMLRS